MKGVVAIVVLALVGVCFGYQNPTVTVPSIDLFPEGIVYDSVADVFYLSSLQKSFLSIVNPESGAVTGTFTDAELTEFATLGMAIDENSTPRRLLVAGINRAVFAHMASSASPLPATTSMLFSFALPSKTFQWSANLTGPAGEVNFANDIAIDTDGTAYVTDSIEGQIWVVTNEGDSSVYLNDPVHFSFAPQDFVGINGIKIVTTDGGKKLLVNKGGGKLYSVPVASGSPTATEVLVIESDGSTSSIYGATDGLFVFGSEIVTVGDSAAVSLYTIDNWATAVIDDWQELTTGGVSTVANYDGVPAVIHSFGTLFLYGVTGVTPYIEFVRIDTDPATDPSKYELVVGTYYNDGECVETSTCCCHVGPVTIVGPMPYLIDGKNPVLVYGAVSGGGCQGATVAGYNMTFTTGDDVELVGSITLFVGVEIEIGLTIDFASDFHSAVLSNDVITSCVNSWTDVPTTCEDETKNGDEAGVDCGGSCAAECPSNTCTDGEKNGDEDGIDCGGSCVTECPSGYEAASGLYTPDGNCVPSATCCCYTGVLRADGYVYANTLFVTSGLDGGAGCGGLTFAGYNMTFGSLTEASVSLEFMTFPFTIGMEFTDDYEEVTVTNSLLPGCPSNFARNEPTCEDGFMNGDETDVDDGGSCTPIDSVAMATGSWVSDGSCVPSSVCCCYIDATTRDNGFGQLYAGGHVEGAACQGITYGAYNMSFGDDPYSASVVIELFGFDVTLSLTFGDTWQSAVLLNSVFPSCVNTIVRGTVADPTCADGDQNGDETAVDCGGSCTACATCSDGIMNQNEEDVDCGGVCEECPSEASGSVVGVSVVALLAAVVAAFFNA